MTVFLCRSCGAALTVPVSRVVMPPHAHESWDYGLMGPLMEPGTFAVDPLPFGPPWRPWDQPFQDEDRSYGWYRLPTRMSRGPAGTVVLAPGDVRGTVLDAGLAGENACCGWAGQAGPNMRCGDCDQLVATRIDDCGCFNATRLDPRAVRAVDGEGPHPVVAWDDLLGGRLELRPSGAWDPSWPAAVAESIAHLLVASGGSPVSVPDGRVAELFRPALDSILPAGDGLSLVLAGPGRPASGGDIALVPRHPQTGEHWPVPEISRTVALAWDAWAHLAFGHLRKAVADPMDDPRVPLTGSLFRPSYKVLRTVLARMPEARAPWLRKAFGPR
ncbi:hypothetical protein AB0G04_33765 [Actinoplanes sp. NPDC023801]|uniref:hypothetical protein n=1 Tax=Actinoplanes sp. NPDC023801 TaxID=3154595 RepID=UPI0033DB18D6